MPKQKTNKGLMKRIKITKSGKVKFKRAFGRHLKSHKPGSQVRSYRRARYATAGDVRRLQPITPRKITAVVRKPGD